MAYRCGASLTDLIRTVVDDRPWETLVADTLDDLAALARDDRIDLVIHYATCRQGAHEASDESRHSAAGSLAAPIRRATGMKTPILLFVPGHFSGRVFELAELGVAVANPTTPLLASEAAALRLVQRFDRELAAAAAATRLPIVRELARWSGAEARAPAGHLRAGRSAGRPPGGPDNHQRSAVRAGWGLRALTAAGLWPSSDALMLPLAGGRRSGDYRTLMATDDRARGQLLVTGANGTKESPRPGRSGPGGRRRHSARSTRARR